MTQLRNLLERIEQGTGPSLGFGAAQSSRLPAMALIARCSGDVAAALAAASGSADAVVVASPTATPDTLPPVEHRIWGIGGIPLEPENVARWQSAGADFMVSPLAGAAVDAVNVAQPGMTHGVRIPDDPDDGVWRTLVAAPLDFVVLDKSAMTGPWTFAELGQAHHAAHNTGKFLIVRVGLRPSVNELAALRRAGAVGIVAEANQLGADGLASLKADLMALPRVQPAAGRRVQPNLDSSAT